MDSEGQHTTDPGAEDLTGTSVGRFVIRAKLGAGGMGEVYRADDTKLKRSVALKRMAPRFQSDANYRLRFAKEAERASCLNDSHIAAIHDIIEQGDEIFLVMELIEGMTVRQRLKEPMTIEEFYSMAVQCAEALAAAYDKGIIHRDIKPENIMLTPAGQVKILDFGVAKRLSLPQPSAATASMETPAGALSGTPAYMAPEVLLEKNPDGRTDIFSLGVVFYEVLAGRNPFLCESFMATSDRILHEVPAALSKINAKVTPELATVVERMLAKNPDDRYATAHDLVADLRGLTSSGRLVIPLQRKIMRGIPAPALAVLMLILVFVAAWVVWRNLGKRPPYGQLPGDMILAVMPFSTLEQDPGAKAFGDGLTETVGTKLTQLTQKHPLQVVSPSEIRSQRITSIEQARQGLGVNLVLEGSLHRAGDRVRINFTLVDAKTRHQIRADSVTATTSDPFAVEDQVVEGIVRMLGVEVNPDERQALAVRGTQIASAFTLYLQGRGFLQNYDKPENIDSAISLFTQALQLDPSYAQAAAGLGEAYWRQYEASKEVALVEWARKACERADSLNAKLAEAQVCLGTVHNGTGRYEKAAQEFQRALDNEPTRDDAYNGLATAYERLARPADAEKAFQQAIEIRPHYWGGYNWLGAFYYRQGRYPQAAEMFRKVVALSPESFRGYSNLGGTYFAQGRYDEAIPALDRSAAIRPTAFSLSNLATAYFYLSEFKQAARKYEEAAKLDDRDYQVQGNLGDAYFWAPGERAHAADAYRRAIGLAEEALRVNPRDVSALGYLAYYHAMLNERDKFLACVQRAVAAAPGDQEMRFNVALAYNQLGEVDKSLEWLSKALSAGYSPTIVRDTPILANLHVDRRFQGLVRAK
jgi:tetratricopeptide (TPR) repeat protein/TolB-like protein